MVQQATDVSDPTRMAIMIDVFARSRDIGRVPVDVIGAAGVVSGNVQRSLLELDMYRRDHLDAVPLRRMRQFVLRTSHLLTFRLAAAIEALAHAVAAVDLVQRNQLDHVDRVQSSLHALVVGVDQALEDHAADVVRAGGGDRADLLLSEIDLLRQRVDALEQAAAAAR